MRVVYRAVGWSGGLLGGVREAYVAHLPILVWPLEGALSCLCEQGACGHGGVYQAAAD